MKLQFSCEPCAFCESGHPRSSRCVGIRDEYATQTVIRQPVSCGSNYAFCCTGFNRARLFVDVLILTVVLLRLEIGSMRLEIVILRIENCILRLESCILRLEKFCL